MSRTAIIYILLFVGYLLSLYYGFGAVYFIFAALYLIFTNLSDEKTEGLSAYSFFNPNCEKILGTVSAEQLQSEMLGVPVMHNSYDKNNHSDEEEEDEEDSHEKALRMARQLSLYNTTYIPSKSKSKKTQPKSDEPALNGPCPCGSGEKYKRCCGKKKKL